MSFLKLTLPLPKTAYGNECSVTEDKFSPKRFWFLQKSFETCPECLIPFPASSCCNYKEHSLNWYLHEPSRLKKKKDSFCFLAEVIFWTCRFLHTVAHTTVSSEKWLFFFKHSFQIETFSLLTEGTWMLCMDYFFNSNPWELHTTALTTSLLLLGTVACHGIFQHFLFCLTIVFLLKYTKILLSHMVTFTSLIWGLPWHKSRMISDFQMKLT